MLASPEFGIRLPARTGKQVRERYHNYLQKNFNQEPFDENEACMVFELHKQLGKRWSLITKELAKLNPNALLGAHNQIT